MMRSAPFRSAASAAAALMLAGAGLAGCGREHAPESAPPPPPVVEQPLAGAPDGPPPSYVAPQPPAGAPVMEAPSAVPPGIVAMAPIPNPPEPEHRARFHRPYRRMHRFVPATRHARHRPARRTHMRASPSRMAVATRRAKTPRLRPAAPVHGRHAGASASGAAVAKPDAAAAASPRADRVAALQTALGSAVTSSAMLAAPHFAVNTPADVTLTVPAAFADTLRTEAGRQGLADDAASAALTSRLSGDGYVVIPDAAQRQVIVAGQPTVFHWTATQQPGARGPLQAQLGAQLLGGGQDVLDLGAVKAGPNGGAGWKIVGGVLLALVLALVVALFTRSGRTRPAVVARRRDVGVQRPFDMGGDEPPVA